MCGELYGFLWWRIGDDDLSEFLCEITPQGVYIINSAGIAYHQNEVLYIIKAERFAYDQADSFLMHT